MKKKSATEELATEILGSVERLEHLIRLAGAIVVLLIGLALSCVFAWWLVVHWVFTLKFLLIFTPLAVLTCWAWPNE